MKLRVPAMALSAASGLFGISVAVAQAAQPAPGTPAAAPPPPKNLQVFPKDISRAELISNMRFFTQALEDPLHLLPCRHGGAAAFHLRFRVRCEKGKADSAQDADDGSTHQHAGLRPSAGVGNGQSDLLHLPSWLDQAAEPRRPRKSPQLPRRLLWRNRQSAGPPKAAHQNRERN